MPRPPARHLDECPARAHADLQRLADALDRDVPGKLLDRNLLLATWNIRSLGGYTRRWMSGAGDSPKRDIESLHCIAEIVSRFDVLAIQEVKSDTSALRAIYDLLGPSWSLILTDTTEGKLGNGERMAFLFDTRRVQLSGLACEIVIPPEHLARKEALNLQRQFARTPYAVGFRTGQHTVTLVALHVLWGDAEIERVRELRAIAEWLAAWSRDKHAWDHNLITLGDFNIDREGGSYHHAFTSTGLHVPPEIRGARRTVFDRSPRPTTHYDQIAWFENVKGSRPLTLQYVQGGSFDFSADAMASRGLAPRDLSWCLSDHLPLWVEFAIQAG